MDFLIACQYLSALLCFYQVEVNAVSFLLLLKNKYIVLAILNLSYYFGIYGTAGGCYYYEKTTNSVLKCCMSFANYWVHSKSTVCTYNNKATWSHFIVISLEVLMNLLLNFRAALVKWALISEQMKTGLINLLLFVWGCKTVCRLYLINRAIIQLYGRCYWGISSISISSEWTDNNLWM